MTAETPCRENPSLWDLDHTITNADIAACIDACLNHCPHLEPCRNYLADMDEAGQPVHGVIAGQLRAWGPDWNPNKGPRTIAATTCVLCGAACVARSALERMPQRFAGYRWRHRNGLCHPCYASQQAVAS